MCRGDFLSDKWGSFGGWDLIQSLHLLGQARCIRQILFNRIYIGLLLTWLLLFLFRLGRACSDLAWPMTAQSAWTLRLTLMVMWLTIQWYVHIGRLDIASTWSIVHVWWCITCSWLLLGSSLTIWRCSGPSIGAKLLGCATRGFSVVRTGFYLRSGGGTSLQETLCERARYGLAGLTREYSLGLAQRRVRCMHRWLILPLILECFHCNCVHQMLRSLGWRTRVLDDKHLLIYRCLSEVSLVPHWTQLLSLRMLQLLLFFRLLRCCLRHIFGSLWWGFIVLCRSLSKKLVASHRSRYPISFLTLFILLARVGDLRGGCILT